MIKERIIYLDYLRCIACLMVILMHSPMPNLGTNSLILSAISYLSAPCIGLFFMVSGALLLPIAGTSHTFLTKRCSKIVYPTLFWSVAYIVIRVTTGELKSSELLETIVSIPFGPSALGVLWFMYVLFGLYLVIPILSPWIQKATKREIEFYLLVWGGTLCLPLIKLFAQVPDDVYNPFYYITGFLGYVVLGYYLQTYKSPIRIRFLLLATIGSIAAYICSKVSHAAVDYYSVFWYLSIFVAIMAMTWFAIIQKNVSLIHSPRIKKYIIRFSNYSFGIYLIHILVMRYILWKVPLISQLGGVIQIILTFILTIVISYLLISCVSKFKFAQYIIGYSERKK